MNKIGVKDSETIKSIHDALELSRSKFNSLSLELNKQLQEVVESFKAEHEDELEGIQNEYDTAQNQLIEVVSIQTGKMDSYMSDRQDSWHDKSAGVVFNDWLETWTDFSENVEAELDLWVFEGIDLIQSVPNILPQTTKPKI